MNFKYFLRGLGVGIVFSAIICLTVYNGNVKNDMSDAEIIQRAKQLGYVKEDDVVEQKLDQFKNTSADKTVAKEDAKAKDDKSSKDTKTTAEVTENKSETTKDNSNKANVKQDKKDTVTEENNKSEDATTQVKTTEEKTTQEATTEAKTTEQVTTEAKKKDDNKNQEKKSDDMVAFTIEPGSSSYPVCLKLKELGLVDNAEEFDTYLVENGYANRISVGDHSLKKGMSYHDIAEAISDPLEE